MNSSNTSTFPELTGVKIVNSIHHSVPVTSKQPPTMKQYIQTHKLSVGVIYGYVLRKWKYRNFYLFSLST